MPCAEPALVQGNGVGALVQGHALEFNPLTVADDDGDVLAAGHLVQGVERRKIRIWIVEAPDLGGAVQVPHADQAVAQAGEHLGGVGDWQVLPLPTTICM